MPIKSKEVKPVQAWGCITHNNELLDRVTCIRTTMFDQPVTVLLTADYKALQKENKELGKKLDALLNHCDKEGGECSECSKIICPYKDPFHFHHDGCPSCYTEQKVN